jgi:CysZ protein
MGAEFAAAVGRELQKLVWSLPRVLGLLLLGLVPGLNMLSAPLSLLVGAWIMAVQFADFSPENRGLSFREARNVLGERQAVVLGFGLPTAFGIGIPFLNLLVAPAAVAGGTAIWLRCCGEWDGRRGLDSGLPPD